MSGGMIGGMIGGMTGRMRGAIRLRVPEVADPDFSVELEPGEVPVLRMVGSADSAATVALGRLLEDVHGALVERRAHEVVVDVRHLDRMIPPCFNELLGWLDRVQRLDPAERYRLRFRFSAAIGWQQNCVPALSCFDTDLITVET